MRMLMFAFVTMATSSGESAAPTPQMWTEGNQNEYGGPNQGQHPGQGSPKESHGTLLPGQDLGNTQQGRAQDDPGKVQQRALLPVREDERKLGQRSKPGSYRSTQLVERSEASKKGETPRGALLPGQDPGKRQQGRDRDDSGEGEQRAPRQEKDRRNGPSGKDPEERIREGEETSLMQGGVPPWRRQQRVVATETTRTFKGRGKPSAGAAKGKEKGGKKAREERKGKAKGAKRRGPQKEAARNVRQRRAEAEAGEEVEVEVEVDPEEWGQMVTCGEQEQDTELLEQDRAEVRGDSQGSEADHTRGIEEGEEEETRQEDEEVDQAEEEPQQEGSAREVEEEVNQPREAETENSPQGDPTMSQALTIWASMIVGRDPGQEGEHQVGDEAIIDTERTALIRDILARMTTAGRATMREALRTLGIRIQLEIGDIIDDVELAQNPDNIAMMQEGNPPISLCPRRSGRQANTPERTPPQGENYHQEQGELDTDEEGIVGEFLGHVQPSHQAGEESASSTQGLGDTEQPKAEEEEEERGRTSTQDSELKQRETGQARSQWEETKSEGEEAQTSQEEQTCQEEDRERSGGRTAKPRGQCSTE